MRKWLITMLGGHVGGFQTIEEAIQHVRDIEDSKNRHAILTLAVKRLFNTVSEEDVLKIHNVNQWTYQGKPLREQEVKLLKAEAVQYQKTFLYKVLHTELKYQSNKRMFINSADIPDLVAGKIMLYYVDVVNSVLKRIAQ